MPLNELPARVNRFAYRAYTADPNVSNSGFRLRLGKAMFGNRATDPNIADLLFLQDCWFNGADWFSPALLLRPVELKRRAETEKWPPEKLESESYLRRVEWLRAIAKRCEGSANTNEREMSRISSWIVSKWEAAQ